MSKLIYLLELETGVDADETGLMTALVAWKLALRILSAIFLSLFGFQV